MTGVSMWAFRNAGETQESGVNSPLQRPGKACMKGVYLCAQLISGGLGSGKTADGGGFGIVDVENGEEFGQLQDFVEFLAEIAEAYGGAGIFCAEMGGDQSAEARAVDISDFSHVQNDLLLSGGDEALEFLAESSALFAQNNAAV